MRYLLVGGTNDGERVELPHPLERLKMIKRVRWFVRLPIPTEQDTAKNIHTEYYVAQPWRTGDHEFTVYAIDGMKTHEQFQHLIDGYTPKKRREDD